MTLKDRNLFAFVWFCDHCRLVVFLYFTIALVFFLFLVSGAVVSGTHGVTAELSFVCYKVQGRRQGDFVV